MLQTHTKRPDDNAYLLEERWMHTWMCCCYHALCAKARPRVEDITSIQNHVITNMQCGKASCAAIVLSSTEINQSHTERTNEMPASMTLLSWKLQNQLTHHLLLWFLRFFVNTYLKNAPSPYCCRSDCSVFVSHCQASVEEPHPTLTTLKHRRGHGWVEHNSFRAPLESENSW